jgi:hypothetical protein
MRVLLGLVLLAACGNAVAVPEVIYADALANGFEDWSWGTHVQNNPAPVHGGNASIRFTPAGWAAVYYVDPASTRDASAYESLTFWIHGGAAGGQNLSFALRAGSLSLATLDLAPYAAGGIAAGTWHQVTIPFNAATGLAAGAFDGFWIADNTGGTQTALYIDDIQLVPRTTPPPTTAQSVSVNLAANVRAIDPDIYGVSFGTPAQIQAVGYTSRRWGGNSVTRYNWQAVAHSSASDWFYINYGPSQTDNADTFITQTRAAGAQAFITVPTIGWAPNLAAVPGWGYSVAKYGPQNIVEANWGGSGNTDAGNGECGASNTTGHCVNGKIVGNDPLDTSIAVGPAFQAQWIAHLQGLFGTAANGGVRHYALDNEVMLWNSTHRDVHPAPATYDEIWQKTVAYASAIKAQDPGALITGPVTWGWCDLFGSAADNCLSGSDRDAHGGKPFVRWYLEQVCAYQQQHGIRLVDYLDVHYYPQGDHIVQFDGNLSVSETAAVSALRLRSLKELYDSNYVSESWIGTLGDDPTWHYSKPALIPRLKSWIAATCPGTKLAITEYNWGPDQGASGALAQAEALAIFGREGVDMAHRWVAPEPGSYAEDAFKLFLNYDGTRTRVVGDSVAATSSDADALGAYAVRRAGQKVYVLLFNKSTTLQDVSVNFSVPFNGAWQVYRFDGSHHIAAAGNGTIAGSSLLLNAVPPRSASLLVLPDAGAVDPALLFRDGFETP